MAKVKPVGGYLFRGIGVSVVRPELLSAGGTVHLLGELGGVFRLFDIGLHFSTAHVRRQAADIFGLGPLQVGASTILIGGCAWALGLSPIAALVIGITLALSSTRSEEHTSELQSLMRISYAVFCLKKKKHNNYLSKYRIHMY